MLVLWYINVKNGAITVDQAVKKEWGNVETSYQRRNDLIGNLVKTVKGAAPVFTIVYTYESIDAAFPLVGAVPPCHLGVTGVPSIWTTLL